MIQMVLGALLLSNLSTAAQPSRAPLLLPGPAKTLALPAPSTRELPRFKPAQELARTELSIRACGAVWSLPLQAAKSGGGVDEIALLRTQRRQSVKKSMESWSDRGGYSPEQLQKLAEFETSLPHERAFYVSYESTNSKQQTFLSFRIFDGNERTAGDDHRLPMERKFDSMKMDRTTPVYEVGLFAATNNIHEAARSIVPLLAREAEARIQEGVSQSSRFVLTARPVQARLYRQIGFRLSAQKTPDGMFVMEIGFRELIELVGKDRERNPLTHEDYKRISAEGGQFSELVQENYRTFWHQEHLFEKDPTKHDQQWESYGTVRSAPPRIGEDFFVPGQYPTWDHYVARRQFENDKRNARVVAARLVVEDREKRGHRTSFALRRIAYYESDYVPENLPAYHPQPLRLRAHSKIGGGWFKVVREIKVDMMLAAPGATPGTSPYNHQGYESRYGVRSEELAREEQFQRLQHMGRDW